MTPSLEESVTKKPVIRSINDLSRVEVVNPETNTLVRSTFYHITLEDEVWLGCSPRRHTELTLDEVRLLLERVPDERLFPLVPEETDLTYLPEKLDYTTIFIKRPGFSDYDSTDKKGWIPGAFLDEALIMEQISRAAQPIRTSFATLAAA